MLVYIPYMDPMGRYMAALQVNWSDEEFHSALRELQKEDSSPPPGVSPSRFDWFNLRNKGQVRMDGKKFQKLDSTSHIKAQRGSKKPFPHDLVFTRRLGFDQTYPCFSDWVQTFVAETSFRQSRSAFSWPFSVLAWVEYPFHPVFVDFLLGESPKCGGLKSIIFRHPCLTPWYKLGFWAANLPVLSEKLLKFGLTGSFFNTDSWGILGSNQLTLGWFVFFSSRLG